MVENVVESYQNYEIPSGYLLASDEKESLLIENSYILYMYVMRSPITREKYGRRLKIFFDFLGLKGDIREKCLTFYNLAKNDPNWVQFQLMQYIDYQKERIEKDEMMPSTINNYYKSIKLFCEMNDIILNWKKIAKGKPAYRDHANDRTPTVEEIRKLIEFPDRRIKVAVLIMISSGIRVDAFDYLKWKHIIPKKDDNGNVIAAKIIVYAGDKEEYFSFISAEGYTALHEYVYFRASCGEKITGESWVLRDTWKSTNVARKSRGGLATIPKKLKSSGIRSIVARAEWEQGLRQALDKGKNRHEFQALHGFRKFFKSQAEQVMKPANVELLMGHQIGVSSSYYKPKDSELFEDYLMMD